MDEKEFVTELLSVLALKGIPVYKDRYDVPHEEFGPIAILNGYNCCGIVSIFPGDWAPRQISWLVEYPFEVKL